MPKLVGKDRAAEVLDVPPRRIYDLVRDGALEAVFLGPKQMRIKVSSLNRLVREGAPKRMEIRKDSDP